jgi:hypothetical protein
MGLSISHDPSRLSARVSLAFTELDMQRLYVDIRQHVIEEVTKRMVQHLIDERGPEILWAIDSKMITEAVVKEFSKRLVSKL